MVNSYCVATWEADLLHGCPGLSEWSGETVGEWPSLSADIRLNLHPHRVAETQRVGSLEWEIPGDEIEQWANESTYIKILINTHLVSQYYITPITTDLWPGFYIDKYAKSWKKLTTYCKLLRRCKTNVSLK